MSALEPGLYRATVRGVADTVVMVDDDGIAGHTGEFLAVGNGNNYRAHLAKEITDARPLIVLDLKNDLRREYVLEILRAARHGWTHDIADQIEAQTKPARIPEPGLWGVVEAGWPDELGAPCHWVHDEYGWASHGGSTFPWDRLIDPTLIREGVTS